MFSNGYVGTAEDSNRIRRQEKERETERKKYEAAAKAKQDQANEAGLMKFAATTTEALEHAFKNETIGLISKADFVKKRTTLHERMEEELRQKLAQEEDALNREKERKRLLKHGKGAAKLSFVADEEEDAEEESDNMALAPSLPPSFFKLLPPPTQPQTADTLPGPDPMSSRPSGTEVKGEEVEKGSKEQGGLTNFEAGVSGMAQGGSGAEERGKGEGEMGGGEGRREMPDAKRQKSMKKVGKDPSVVTIFLPDRDRAKKEEELRNQLKKEWQAQQDTIKAEPLAIVYSYWDGTGHRREIRVKKGDTIGGFLKAVREQLITDFRELRHVSVDNLLYVKEDIILPHHHTFHDLIITKARGKSGPLFEFGVHEDIRVVNDASREKNESHAGKVVERHWYDRNKHIFPASRWEVFDPEKKYESYSIYG